MTARLGTMALLVVLLGSSGCAVPAETDAAAGSTPTPAAGTADPVDGSPSPSAPPPLPEALIDGIYEVGVDIPPGPYTTTVSDGACYWARLASFDGTPGSFLAEGNPEPDETPTVIVRPTDRGFKVANGCRWRPGTAK